MSQLSGCRDARGRRHLDFAGLIPTTRELQRLPRGKTHQENKNLYLGSTFFNPRIERASHRCARLVRYPVMGSSNPSNVSPTSGIPLFRPNFEVFESPDRALTHQLHVNTHDAS